MPPSIFLCYLNPNVILATSLSGTSSRGRHTHLELDCVWRDGLNKALPYQTCFLEVLVFLGCCSFSPGESRLLTKQITFTQFSCPGAMKEHLYICSPKKLLSSQFAGSGSASKALIIQEVKQWRERKSLGTSRMENPSGGKRGMALRQLVAWGMSSGCVN